MAQSNCIRCGHSSFELAPAEVDGSNYKLYFVQCSSCGGVVSTQEYLNIGATMEKQVQKPLKTVATNVNSILSLVQQIASRR